MPELEARLDAVIRRSQHPGAVRSQRPELNLDTMEVSQAKSVAFANPVQHLARLIRESPKVVTVFVRERASDELPDSDTCAYIYNLRRIIDRPSTCPAATPVPGYCLRIRAGIAAQRLCITWLATQRSAY